MKYQTVDVQAAIARVRSFKGHFTLERLVDALDPKLNRAIDQASKNQKAEIAGALQSLINDGQVSSYQRNRGEEYIFTDERHLKHLKEEAGELLQSVTNKIEEHKALLIDGQVSIAIPPETLPERLTYAMEAVSFFARMVPKDFGKFPPIVQVIILRLVDRLILSQRVADAISPPDRQISELREVLRRAHEQIGHVDRTVATLSAFQDRPSKDIRSLIEDLARALSDLPSLER